MEHNHRDFFVGLFLLLTLGVVIGAFLVTSDVLKGEYDVYLQAETADGIDQDTRVVYQGLQIGQVTAIFPVRTGSELSFVARLTIAETFPDGSELILRRGTTALIEQPLPFTASFITIVPSADPSRGLLQPGDTLVSSRSPGTIDAIVDVLFDLKNELGATLADTRTMLESSTALLNNADRAISETTPALKNTLQGISDNLSRADAILAEIGPRVGPMADSVTATLATAHAVMLHLDSVSAGAELMMQSFEAPIESALASIADQVRQRPTRILTGVGPLPPPDTTERSR